jgi:predicted benzoate:H+ symporter BenE
MNADDFVQASNRHYLVAIVCSLAAVLCSLVALFSPFLSALPTKFRHHAKGEKH